MIELNTVTGKLVYHNAAENPPAVSPKYILQTFVKREESNQDISYEEQVRNDPYASRLTSRNYNKNYLVPMERENVLINFIPQKTVIRGTNFDYKVNPNFESFAPLEFRNELPDPFTLEDGTIFRVTGEGVKKSKEYTHYTVDNGVVKKIPNWQTTAVLLAERGGLLESIRVIEPRQYNDLIRQSNVNSLVQNGMAVEEAEQVANEIQTGKNPTFPLPPSAIVQQPTQTTGPNAAGTSGFPAALPPTGPVPSSGGFGAPPPGSPSAPTGPGGVSSGGGGGLGGFASGPNGSSSSAGVTSGGASGGGAGGAGGSGAGGGASGGGAGGGSGAGAGAGSGGAGGAGSGGSGGAGGAGGGAGGGSGAGAGAGAGSGAGAGGAGGGAGGGGGAGFPDLSSEYTDDMDLISTTEAFMELSDTTGGQCQTMQAFQDAVDQNIDTLNNEIDSVEAEADAAKAEAEAAKAEADAAKAEADAIKAQADAAKAEADAAKADADALKAELELQLQQQNI